MRKYFALIINLCLIHFLLGLDINIVSVSLPYISSHFNVEVSVVSRVVWVYFLVLTCFLLAFGRLGDIKGFKKIYIAGIFIFLSGSLLCYFANNFNLLVVFRIYQAFGSAILFALTPAIIASGIPEEMRGRVYGINYSFTALGGIIGRAASGFLIEGLGWNSIFLINIPIGIIALIITFKYLDNYQNANVKSKFDVTGTVLVFLGLFLLLYGINTGDYFGWTSLTTVSLFISSVLFVGAFLIRQYKISYPLLNLRILKDKNISYSVLSFVFVYIITNGMIYITPFLLLWIKGLAKQETGLLMAVPSLFQFFSGYLSGYLSDKINSGIVRIIGIISIAVSVILYILISPDTDIYIIILILSFYGFAIGFFIPSNTNNIMTSAPAEQKGIISSFMTTSIRLGSALGVVIFGAVFSYFVPVKNPVQNGVEPFVLLSGFKAAFIFGFVAALIGLYFVLRSRNGNYQKDEIPAKGIQG
ncbi:MAG: MFS transporter [Candidatus Kapaibacterium sp.]